MSVYILLSLACLNLVGCVSTQALRAAPLALMEARGCELLVDLTRSTFVLLEIQTGRTRACNINRARERFVPASTFKIPHALFALEAAAGLNENTRFIWDGRPRGVNVWNKDTKLVEALQASTVWVFQDIASRIGHAREGASVRRLRYGNQQVGRPDQLRHFWLSGPLKISAIEQVQFLVALRAGELDADRQVQQRVVAMLRMRSCGQGCVLYGKTGAVLPIDDEGFLRQGAATLLPAGEERTGWYVGWIERPEPAGGTVVFVHNLDLSLPGSMAARTKVAHDLLRANGILVEEE